MSNTSIPDQPIDPELKELLNLLRIVPERDPNDITHSREEYLSQIDSIFKPEPISFKQRLAILLPFRRLDQNKNDYFPRTKKFAYSIVLIIVVMTTILFSGAGATAYASQSALPGDALYAVKTSVEATRIRLANNAATQAKLHLQFAERRLDELSILVKERRYGDIETATLEFEFHVNQAIQALQIVSAGDPVGAQGLAAQISSALSRYAQILMELTAGLPERVQESILRAMNFSQSASQFRFDAYGENQGEGDPFDDGFKKTNENGSNFEEREDSQSPENSTVAGNENENENENDDHNGNMNSNTNDNEDNRNGDDDYSNSNENDDDRDDNGNDDDRESGSNHNGGNDNDNDNSDDDDNDNSDDSDNDNNNDD